MGETTDQLRREIEETRGDISRDVDNLTYKASPSRMVSDRVERTRSRFSGVKDRVFGSVSDAGSSAGGTLGSARESVSSAASSTAGAVQAAPDVARRQTEGNPMAAGLIAFGVGWLVSSLLPASETEARAAQQVTDAAKEHAQPVVEEAKQAAAEVGQNLKEPAREAAESVKATAQQGAQEVKDQGTSAAQEVREQARSSG